jgi:adenine-specific DNA-methyltransferase
VIPDNNLSFPNDLIDQVICADAFDIMPTIPDRSVDIILTDPPWWNTQVKFSTIPPVELFTRFVQMAARLTERLIVVLGCDTDPRPLSAVPAVLPFFRIVWLRRIPGSYRGPLFYDADVAYVFGHRRLNGKDRVIGGESSAVLQLDKDDENPHPTKRHLHHMSWLVRFLSRPGQLILDPFCGSGSALVAAARAGRHYCGIDINPQYVDYALLRLEREKGLFDGARSSVSERQNTLSLP